MSEENDNSSTEETLIAPEKPETVDISTDETLLATPTVQNSAKPKLWDKIKDVLSSLRKRFKLGTKKAALAADNNAPPPADKSTPEPEQPQEENSSQEQEAAERPPHKPGFLSQLTQFLSHLIPGKKPHSDVLPDESTPKPEQHQEKNSSQEQEAAETPPHKPGFLSRLTQFLSNLIPSKKSHSEVQPGENTEEPEASEKHSSKKKRGEEEESESSEIPEKSSHKKLIIALAILVPLIAGGSFFIVSKVLQKPSESTAPEEEATQKEEPKKDEPSAPEAAQTEKPTSEAESEQPPTEGEEPQPTESADAPPAEESPAPEATSEPSAEAATEEPAPEEGDTQAQLAAMKKHQQEMMKQIEALKSKPAARPATTPRDGVLIINGKNSKESVQGLKQVIESMNGTRAPSPPEKK